MKTLNQFAPTLFFLTLAVFASFTVQHSPLLTSVLSVGFSGFYISLALLLVVGYSLNFLPQKNNVPVFVWAILFGMALQVVFASLSSSPKSLLVIIQILATYVLFASGIRVPVKNFKKYFAPIATLSILGTLLTVLLFAFSLSILTVLFGFTVSSIALLVLAAILSSIDPATVIPTLEHLHFKRPFLRDIAISESALNDVVGVIITRFFLVAALGTATATTLTIGQSFLPILSAEAVQAFMVEIVWGTLIGILGAWILKTWGESVGKKHWSDKALFIIVPLFCFALGSMLGGTGFLAAFVAGLLFESDHKTHEVQNFFTEFVDRFLKPVIFVLMGVFAPLAMLVATAGIGAVSAILFIFIIRPFVVSISLLPWMITKKSLLHWREIVFLSFIRETGAIPAVLIIFTAILGIAGADFIFAIGVWIILYTLVIEPPLTSLIAKRLEVAD